MLQKWSYNNELNKIVCVEHPSKTNCDFKCMQLAVHSWCAGCIATKGPSVQCKNIFILFIIHNRKRQNYAKKNINPI